MIDTAADPDEHLVLGTHRLRDVGLEGEADDVMLELLREVYGGKYEPLQAMMVRDLYDVLEKVIDRCRDAGNVMSHIVLKNS